MQPCKGNYYGISSKEVTFVKEKIIEAIDSMRDEIIEIGDYVSVGHNVTIHGATVKDYALIGMGATVLDGAVVGEGAIVAAGALVLSNTIIEPNTIWAGVPAKMVKKVDPKQSQEINQRIAHNYAMYASWYK